MEFTEDKLKEYVKRRLGNPVVDVELTNEQLDDIVRDVVLVYSRWKPIRVHQAYSGREGILKVTPSSNPALPAKINGVLDLDWTTNLAQGNPNIEAQMLSGTFAFYGVRAPLYDMRFYEYQREWVRFAGKELSSRPDWCFRLNEETGEPNLWLYSPGYATDWDVTFSRQHANLKTIPDFDENRIRNLAVARAKMVLGTIFSKYDKVMIANTGMVLNPRMYSEGETEWTAEEDALRKSVVDQAPIWG